MQKQTHLASSSSGVPGHLARSDTCTFFCRRISTPAPPAARPPTRRTVTSTTAAAPDRAPRTAAMRGETSTDSKITRPLRSGSLRGGDAGETPHQEGFSCGFWDRRGKMWNAARWRRLRRRPGGPRRRGFKDRDPLDRRWTGSMYISSALLKHG
jgi:hypothetical protein